MIDGRVTGEHVGGHALDGPADAGPRKCLLERDGCWHWVFGPKSAT